MATRARKVPDLPSANSINAADYFIIEKVSGGSSVTSKISGTNLKKTVLSGPYGTDAMANTNGVAIGEMYYTPEGVVKVRLY